MKVFIPGKGMVYGMFNQLPISRDEIEAPGKADRKRQSKTR